MSRSGGENPNCGYNDVEQAGNSSSKRSCSRGHWTPSEDAKVIEHVAANGPRNWKLLAQNLDGRSDKSCRLRWFNQLDPTINKNAFDTEEEERLLEAQRMYGNQWAFISQFFPGRRDNDLKNHWHTMTRKHGEQQANKRPKFIDFLGVGKS